jgi:hypothetical protein
MRPRRRRRLRLSERAAAPSRASRAATEPRRPSGTRTRDDAVGVGRARACAHHRGGKKLRTEGSDDARLTKTVAHMFRLDEDLSGFYELVRELRAPTVFEDVVKTT